MNIKNARLWIKALRSGEFEQASGSLRRLKRIGEEGYLHCCLGVVCELYSANVAGFFDEANEFIADFSPEPSNYQEGYEDGFRFYPIKGSNFMPKPVAEWLEVSPFEQSIFAALNDDAGATFEDIAKVVEAAIRLGGNPSRDWWTARANAVAKSHNSEINWEAWAGTAQEVYDS